ncbi:hypothetical protein BJ742DRAFT_777915 [Cladochytrium replicatum]|nr:hypothetical protein BJ742DRAFT_777915 [Cladochytrium replicatum]
METATTRGWMGFGVNTAGGSGMSGAEIFVAEKSSDGSVTLSHRFSSSTVTPQTISGSAITVVSNSTGGNVDSKFVATFDRPKTSSSSQLVSLSSSSSAGVIFAWGPGSFSDHGSNYLGSRATVLSSSNAFSGTSTPSNTTDSGISIDDGAANSATTTADRLRIAHGALMFAAWGIFAPAGVFISRYQKASMGHWWFKLHVGLTGAGVGVLSIVAFVLGVYATPSTRHFSVSDAIGGSHRILGMIVMILMLLQVVLGVFIDRKFDPLRKTIPWHDKAHWWLGRVSILAAIVNLVTGLVYYVQTFGSLSNSTSTGLYAGMGVIFAILVVIFGLYESRIGQSAHVEESKPLSP